MNIGEVDSELTELRNHTTHLRPVTPQYLSLLSLPLAKNAFGEISRRLVETRARKIEYEWGDTSVISITHNCW